MTQFLDIEKRERNETKNIFLIWTNPVSTLPVDF